MATRRKPGDGLADFTPAAPHFLGHRARLRQRLLVAGAEALPDYELLEVLLFAGNPRGDTKPLAKDLIDRFGSLAEVLSAEADDLLSVPGLGEAGVAALKSVREAALRLARAELRARPLLSSWDQLIDYCRATVAYGKVEEFPELGSKLRFSRPSLMVNMWTGVPACLQNAYERDKGASVAACAFVV